MPPNDNDPVKAKAKADADAANAARARVASGENEATNDPPPPPKVAIVPRSSQGADEARRMANSGPGEIVMVACKLPHGLKITLNEKTESDEGKPIWKPTENSVTLAGRNASQIIGGYGLTPVNADFWDAWLAQNKNFKALKAGMIFAEPRKDRAMSRAADQKALPTGSEPIDPDKPGRGLARVPEADQRAAAAMGGAGDI